MATVTIFNRFQVQVQPDGSWKPIGQGSSGIVTLAGDSVSGINVVLKIIPVTLREADRANVVTTLQELYTSEHPSVVTFYGADYYTERNSVIVATEYMDLRSMKDVMQRAGAFPENVIGYLSSRLLDALVYLHRERRMIHRDMKPSNILLNSRGEVKISDFGLSTQLANTFDPANTWVGSTSYMSPERISGQQYNFNSDIWSLGVSLQELAIGHFPYNPPGQKMELVELLDRIVDDEPPKLPSEHFSTQFCDFVSLTLKKRVEERPNADFLIGHPFVVQNAQTDLGPWIQHVVAAMGS